MSDIFTNFEVKFKQMKYSGPLKDLTSKDYKESSLKFLGYRANDIKSFQYEYYSTLNDIEQKVSFLELLFKQSKYSEIKSWALYEFDKFNIEDLIIFKPILISLADYVENWWHCDQLCLLYFKLLQQHKLFFSTIQHFSKFSSLWHRRLALTSIYYYAKQNHSNPIPFEMGISIVESLLKDDEYYVQKAIGWTLKEMSELYYDKTLEFLKIHIKHIPPAGYSASLEKLKEEDKLELQKIRKRGISNKYEFHAHEDREINEFELKAKRYKK